MPTNPALLLRAPLLSSIPTRYDQEDLIPAFRLSDNSEEPDQDDDRPLGPFTTSTSTQPQAYGSLRESQMQQQQQFLRAGSAGKPHSFIRKRGGVGPLQHIITDSDHNNNNNNNAMMTASSAPIRSTLRTTTTTNTTTATSTTTSGLTIGERIQQQRKLQLALLSNQNNSTNNNNETGEMELTGDHISNSGVSTTQPKRNSSILAAMLLDQPAPPPSPPPNNFTEDDRPFWSTQQQQQNPHSRLDTTGSSNTSTQPLSTSFTGLEILQQQGRRPWSHHHHQSSVLPTVPQISRSHSQPGFMTSASDLDHRHGAVDPVHFSLPPTAPYFATTTSTTALAHFTATSWHDRPHRAVATGLEQITTNNNNNNDDDDDFMDENGDNEEDDDDIVETFDLDME